MVGRLLGADHPAAQGGTDREGNCGEALSDPGPGRGSDRRCPRRRHRRRGHHHLPPTSRRAGRKACRHPRLTCQTAPPLTSQTRRHKDTKTSQRGPPTHRRKPQIKQIEADGLPDAAVPGILGRKRRRSLDHRLPAGSRSAPNASVRRSHAAHRPTRPGRVGSACLFSFF